MDKQQFDHIENSIRQAADDISIPFNETAWSKMEVKLDKEFNKDRRRFGIWWWFSAALLIVVAFGLYFYLQRPFSAIAKKSIGQSDSGAFTPSSSYTKNNGSSNTVAPKEKVAQSTDSTQTKPSSSTNGAKSNSEKYTQTLPVEKKSALLKEQTGNLSLSQNENSNTATKQGKTNKIKNLARGKSFNKSIRKIKLQSDDNHEEKVASVVASSSIDLNSKPKHQTENQQQTITSQQSHNPETGKASNKPVDLSDRPASVVSSSADSSSISVAKTDQPVVITDSLKSADSVGKKSAAIKLATRTQKGFYFTASIAADATGVKDLITTKEMKPVYGVGVGYRFNKRLSAQTGFYAGNRAYAAGPDDYYTNPGSYIAKVISAQAECYIYDIPLLVRYDIFKQKNANLYLVSGVSSYILKREYYDIHFYNPMGAYHHTAYTYKHNTDYFSIFDFSVGYERKLSDAFYIQAEPYIKIPLSGVGQGSVKLFSAGIQLGLKYQPFHNKKR